MKFREVPINEVVHSRYSEEHLRSYDSDTFDELSRSVAGAGICTPLRVTEKNRDGKYVVIDGDHRLEAARAAGIGTIPVIIDPDIEPDSPDRREKILNYIHNNQRVNLTVTEAADLFEALSRNCDFEELEEAKARMGISQRRIALFGKLNRLGPDLTGRIESLGMDMSSPLADALLAIEDPLDRQALLERGISDGIRQSGELAAFLQNAGRVLTLFPKGIRIHFNGRELPYSDSVIRLVARYDSEKMQLAAVKKLREIPLNEMEDAAERYLLLLDGSGEMPGCPELEEIILTPEFPYDEGVTGEILRFRALFADEPEKRLFVIGSLLKSGSLSENGLLRISRAIEKSFFGYPEEIREMFWKGETAFSDLVTDAVDALLARPYDLPTKIGMIREACGGGVRPDQFSLRLARAVRERDEMIRDVALQTGTDPESLRNDEEIMRTIGLPEEDIRRIKEDVRNGGTGRDAAQPPATPAELPEEESADDDLRGFVLLADSMARSLGTEKHVELELLHNGENETMTLAKIYTLAEQRCRKCRSERLFNFDTINYCDGCMLSALIGDIEDSAGEN